MARLRDLWTGYALPPIVNVPLAQAKEQVLLPKIKTGYLMKIVFLHVLLHRILIHDNRLQRKSTLESTGATGYVAASKLASISSSIVLFVFIAHAITSTSTYHMHSH